MTILICFLNGKEVCKFKTKNSEIKKYTLCSGSISKDYGQKGVSDIGSWIGYRILVLFMILVLTVLQLFIKKTHLF